MKRLYEIRGETKSCTHCGEFKPFSEFSLNKALKSGLQSHCKSCAAARFRERKLADPEYLARINAQRRAQQPRHKSIKRQNYLREMLYRAKARAKKRGVPFDLTEKDIVIPPACPVFGIPFAIGRDGLLGADDKLSPRSPSLDCIDPMRGYVRGNVQVISNLANAMKSNATSEQLEQFARWVLNANLGDNARRRAVESAGAGAIPTLQ